jgi:hypothetical protein
MSRKTKQPPAFIRRRFLNWRGESLFTSALTEVTSSEPLAQRRHRGISIARLPCPEIFEATPDVGFFVREFGNGIKRIRTTNPTKSRNVRIIERAGLNSNYEARFGQDRRIRIPACPEHYGPEQTETNRFFD